LGQIFLRSVEGRRQENTGTRSELQKGGKKKERMLYLINHERSREGGESTCSHSLQTGRRTSHDSRRKQSEGGEEGGRDTSVETGKKRDCPRQRGRKREPVSNCFPKARHFVA